MSAIECLLKPSVLKQSDKAFINLWTETAGISCVQTAAARINSRPACHNHRSCVFVSTYELCIHVLSSEYDLSHLPVCYWGQSAFISSLGTLQKHHIQSDPTYSQPELNAMTVFFLIGFKINEPPNSLKTKGCFLVVFFNFTNQEALAYLGYVNIFIWAMRPSHPCILWCSTAKNTGAVAIVIYHCFFFF